MFEASHLYVILPTNLLLPLRRPSIRNAAVEWISRVCYSNVIAPSILGSWFQNPFCLISLFIRILRAMTCEKLLAFEPVVEIYKYCDSVTFEKLLCSSGTTDARRAILMDMYRVGLFRGGLGNALCDSWGFTWLFVRWYVGKGVVCSIVCISQSIYPRSDNPSFITKVNKRLAANLRSFSAFGSETGKGALGKI